MITNSRGTELALVKGLGFKNRLKKECKGGLPWSVRCQNLGVGNSFLQNGFYTYSTKMKDDSMIMAYIASDKYEKVCKEFGIDPSEYSDEDKYDKTKKSRNDDTDEICFARLMKKLDELDKHILEMSEAFMIYAEALEQLHLENSPKRKPAANAPKK